MQVFSHRGVWSEFPENSLEAFERAWTVGSDGIEFDVQWSRDEVLVVDHDDFHFDSNGLRKKWAEIDYAALRASQLVTLEQVFQHFEGRNFLFNIEIKPDSKNCLEKVLKCVEKYQRSEDVILSSFQVGIFKSLYEDFSSCSVDRALLIDREVCQLPGGGVIHFKDVMEAYDIQRLHPCIELCSPDFLDSCRWHQWKVVPWSPMAFEESTDRWDYLDASRVYGLCSNNPKALHAWLSYTIPQKSAHFLMAASPTQNDELRSTS